MFGPAFLRDVVDVRGVRSAAKLVGDEVLGSADEVHREAAERFVLLGELLGRDRGHRRGVEATGEQGAARHVRDQLPTHDVLEQFAHVGDAVRPVVGVRCRLQAPVHLFADPVGAHGHDGSGLDLAHSLPPGVAGGLDEGEDLAQPVEVHGALGDRVGQDGLRLRSEEHPVLRRVVVKRLDAHPVADHDELLLAGVPDRERVHAVEPLRDRLGPLEVAAQNYLGVGVGAKPVPPAVELRAQFGEVVRLTGVHHRDRAVRGVHAHRLRTTRKVDDRESTVPERYVLG